MLTDDDYVEIMRSILVAEPCLNNNPNDPSLIMDRLYLGGQRNAENWPTLEKLRVTHVLNCAGFKGQRSYEGSPYDDVGIEYLEFQADDHDDYDITKHFNEAFNFIDRARQRGGVVLVHCALGINRSGATCIAYLMLRAGMPLLKAVKTIKSKRRVLLSNRGFQYRLVKFARKHGLLDDLNDNEDCDDLRKFIRKKILNKPRSRSNERKQEAEEDIDTFIERCRPKKDNIDFEHLANADVSNSVSKSNYKKNDYLTHNELGSEYGDAPRSNRELVFKYKEPLKAAREGQGHYNGFINGPQNGLVKYQHNINYEPDIIDYLPITARQAPSSYEYQPIANYNQSTTYQYQPTTSYYPQPTYTYETINDYRPPVIFSEPPVTLRPRNGPKVQRTRRSANIEEIPLYKGNNIDIFCTSNNSGYEISVSVPQKNKLRRSMSLARVTQPRYYYY